jgi:hypothetical protein
LAADFSILVDRRSAYREREEAIRTSRSKSPGVEPSKSAVLGNHGGERGIRTLETVPRLHTFQACAFDHSAISPRGSPIIRLCGLCQGARCKKAAKLSFEGIICRVRGVQALAVKQILKIRLRIPRSAMLLLTKPFEEIEVR